MMRHQSTWTAKTATLAGLLAGSILTFGLVAQSSPAQATPEKGKLAATQPSVSSPSNASRTSHRFITAALTPKQERFYQLIWGVDIVGVKLVSSGLMVRFSYRVLDANRAKVLNDKKATPFLIDEKSKVQMVVPTMEKVGQLRQASPPENGREYWMVFSNKGNLIKPGSRVDVVIGRFRANGLIVQ